MFGYACDEIRSGADAGRADHAGGYALTMRSGDRRASARSLDFAPARRKISGRRRVRRSAFGPVRCEGDRHRFDPACRRDWHARRLGGSRIHGGGHQADRFPRRGDDRREARNSTSTRRDGSLVGPDPGESCGVTESGRSPPDTTGGVRVRTGGWSALPARGSDERWTVHASCMARATSPRNVNGVGRRVAVRGPASPMPCRGRRPGISVVLIDTARTSKVSEDRLETTPSGRSFRSRLAASSEAARKPAPPGSIGRPRRMATSGERRRSSRRRNRSGRPRSRRGKAGSSEDFVTA